MSMFFFDEEKEPVWRKYTEELGIRQAEDYLKGKGLPAQWPSQVADPDDPYVFYHPQGKPWYRSQCGCYEGYYLGGSGAVKCSAVGELLPGYVWDSMCRKDYEKCPFYQGGIVCQVE